MSGEDQERFEDYLELEHYLEELQAGHDAQLPGSLTPEKARIYRMANLLHSTSTEAGQPRPEFAAELQTRLEQELEHQDHSQPSAAVIVIQQEPAHKPSAPSRLTRPRPNVSRRALLAGSAAVAASLAVGAGIGATVEQQQVEQQENQPPTPPNIAASTSTKYATPAPSEQLLASGTGQWQAVAPLAKLGEGAMRFSSDALVGYLMRTEQDEGEQEPIIAFSAACTHMGCIVKWQDSDRKFHCPCHGGLFTEYGKIDNNGSAIQYLNALPRLRTKVENGTIFVEVPKTISSKA